MYILLWIVLEKTLSELKKVENLKIIEEMLPHKELKNNCKAEGCRINSAVNIS